MQVKVNSRQHSLEKACLSSKRSSTVLATVDQMPIGTGAIDGEETLLFRVVRIRYASLDELISSEQLKYAAKILSIQALASSSLKLQYQG